MTTLEEWAKREQVILWDELHNQIDRANNGHWSMGASGVCQRLIGVAQLVGPTPRYELPWTMDAGGVYDALMEVASIEVRQPTTEEWDGAEQVMAQYGGYRDYLQEKYARTCAAIHADREALLDEG